MQIFTTLLLVLTASILLASPSFAVYVPDESELIRRGIKRLTIYQADTLLAYCEYDRRGLKTRESGFGSTTIYRYDDRGRLIEMIHVQIGAAADFSAYRYEYDQLGRISRIFHSRRKDRADERIDELYRYDTGSTRELWRWNVLRESLELHSITDSTSGKKIVRYVNFNRRLGSNIYFYDAEGSLCGRIDYNGSGEMIHRWRIVDEPCRRMMFDTSFRPGVGPVDVQWSVIDTCARREVQEMMNRSRFTLDSLRATQRWESIIDERGRELERSSFEMEQTGTLSSDSWTERLRYRLRMTYDESGLLVGWHFTDYDPSGTSGDHLRYEYEFYTPEERDGATIR